MKHAWQKKYQKAINSRVFSTALDRRNWCASLCQILIWYGEKHPEKGVDVECAKKALEAIRFHGADVRIRRDKSGFKYEVQRYSLYRGKWQSFPREVTAHGLPPLPEPYTEEALC